MSEWHIRFGTAGTSDSFEAKGYKSSLDIPAYTAEMGLDAFEYQCGHGVRLGVDKAGKMAADAAERGILFSVHAPYYISMSSLCLLYTSPSPRDAHESRMPSSA